MKKFSNLSEKDSPRLKTNPESKNNQPEKIFLNWKDFQWKNDRQIERKNNNQPKLKIEKENQAENTQKHNKQYKQQSTKNDVGL